ncbi:HNH endonuclease [Priestia sp. SIMBA_032]|uniref:HNH endonuclease n=1 Tax=Priestia sp. SIMBA_032 TaxID=3085775 RepID=UPI00397AF2DD
MAKEWAKPFYNSSAWKKCRKSYIVSVFNLCERCGEIGKILHHKEYLTPENINNPEVSLNHELLEYLCQECHNREHHERFGVVQYGLKFDENGELIQVKEVKPWWE